MQSSLTTIPPADISRSCRTRRSDIYFLMVNTFETGGSERQFIVLAQNLTQPRFQTHLGCVSRRGPLALNFPDTPEFPLGGSLYGWKSLRAR